MPMSIYASVNKMVPKLLQACPDLGPEGTAAIKYGADRVMYALGRYVIGKIKAGESDSLFAFCDALEEVLDEADSPARSALGVLFRAIMANGSIDEVSPEPFKIQLGSKGREFWQESEAFFNSMGPLRYGDITY